MNASALLIYMVIQLITPGPSNFMAMFSAARYGLKGAKGYLLGTSTGYAIKTLLCGVLSLALALVLPQVVPYLKWVGGAYFVYLAIHILLDGRKPLSDEEGEGSSTFMSGILLQCLNMKSWIFCLSMFSVYITPYTTDIGTLLLWGFISVMVMVPCTLAYAVFGSAIKKVYNKYRWPCSIVMAAALLYCAVMAVL